jgi:hypothetical protein
MHTRRRRLALALAAGLTLVASQAWIAAAHVIEHAGSYNLEVGWHVEPTYVGYPNAVEITVSDGAGQPVTDLGPDDLHVTVASGSQTSQPLSFDPAFDLEEGDGTPGQYIAKIVPTAPGDYTFAFSGSIHGTKVDVTVTSGDKTFDPAIGTTHLDRLDGRVADAAKAASDAQDAATLAIAVSSGLAATSLLVALIALVVAWRARRRTTTS